MIRKHAKKISGFSLIELMIVVAIIGIIVAFGYPVYTEKMIETRRTDAKEALSRLATLQEKIFTECNQYATVLVTTGTGSSCGPVGGSPSLAWSDVAPFVSADGHYTISMITPPPAGPGVPCTAATCFLLQADPIGVGASGMQTRNGVSDGVLVIDHAGRKSWDKGLGGVMDGKNTGMFVNGTGAVIKWSGK